MKNQICHNRIEKGLGDKHYKMAVYIANTPPLSEYQQLDHVQSLLPGEIHAIAQSCGNGWRKVFNVYAKLLFALDPERFDFSLQASTWQQYRQQNLLQSGSQTALIFGSPLLTDNRRAIRIICGKTHGQQSSGQFDFDWLDSYFAVNRQQHIIICPYFDYRQLTNQRIERLAQLINELK